MKPLHLAALLLLCACAQPHAEALREITASRDCVVCHQEDFNAVVDPLHVGSFPTTCGDCHRTTAWRPALSGAHPEAVFPIAAGAHQLPCLECHDAELGASTAGANTDCTGCHTGNHVEARMANVHGGVREYAFEAANPHFCLRCHPDGQAENHPEDRFPIRAGAHGGLACGSCHNATLGPSTAGMNTDCVGCHEHTRSRVDAQHREEGDYTFDATNPHFCLRCHPRGRH